MTNCLGGADKSKVHFSFEDTEKFFKYKRPLRHLIYLGSINQSVVFGYFMLCVPT